MHPQSRGRRLEIGPRDIAICRLLGRYRYLPSNFIQAFVGGSDGYHKTRMTDLFHEGWLRKPVQQWEMLNARYRFDTYELGAKGTSLLAEQGITPSPLGTGGYYRHELMTCLIMASFELSARKHSVRLSTWQDVLYQAPEDTRLAPAPFIMPMSFDHEGRRFERPLRPDGRPFGLHGRRDFWFVGFEADRHHEPLHPTDLHSRHSSILAKFLQYQHMVRERLFETRYAMSNVLVPVVTVNESHMHNMVELALRVSNGRGFKWLLFACVPDIASVESTVQPNMDFLTTPWVRANNPPLILIDELCR